MRTNFTRKEEIAVFVKADGHNPIGQVEGLLHAITVMNVDIYIQHSRMIFKQLQNGDDDIVYITETGSLELLGMMQAAGPIYSYITMVIVQFHGSLQRSTRIH